MVGPANNTRSQRNTVSVFAPISHPVLRTVDPVKVARFVKEREQYETEVEEKSKEVPNLTKASYKVSVDKSLLETMLFLGKFDSIAPDATSVSDLTDDNIKSLIQSIVTKDDSTFDPKVVDQALSNVAMSMEIADAEARVFQLVHTVFDRLDGVGYGKFKESNPKKMVRLICEKLKPLQLRRVMERRLDYDEKLAANLKGFIKIACKEAVSCQTYVTSKRHKDTVPPLHTNADTGNDGAPKPSRKAPVCLWPPHKEKDLRHFLRDCRNCPEDEKRALLKKNREEREKKNDASDALKKTTENFSKRVALPPDVPSGKSSVLFTATYGGKVQEILCADNGSDMNLMGADLLKRIQTNGGKVVVTKFKNPLLYSMAANLDDGKSARISCTRRAVMDTELHIRHGKTLVLKNLKWMVTDQQVDEPLLGRPVLEALGLNTSDILAAAADKQHGIFDAAQFEDDNEVSGGRVARTMYTGVFHSDGGDDEHNDGNDDWLDFGEDTEDEIKLYLDKLVDEASKNGMSDIGVKHLRAILDEYSDIFRLRLGNTPPAKVQPHVLTIDPKARPYKVPKRRYPEPKRKFLETVTTKLVEFGLIEPCHDADWVHAPLIAPKKPPANFRLTVDLRPINSATTAMSWPMPHLDSEVNDMRDSKFFASLDFPSGFWQLPMAEESRSYHAFWTPRGVMRPTRTLQGGRNAAANFQAKIEPLFSSLRDNLKAWIDDLALHTKTEEELLTVLRSVFHICRIHGLKLSASKCKFFLKSLDWCGRVIDERGIRLSPSNLATMQNVHIPHTAGELCQYVYATGWMSSCFPKFSERIAPLRAILELAFKKSGRRTKKSVSTMLLSMLGWNHEHTSCFHDIQRQLCENVKLSHRNPSLTLCVFTDASDMHWSGIITQCDKKELEKNVDNQSHQPLSFLSGDFTGASIGWTTFEKEAYAIYETFRRADYILLCAKNFRVFTDHRNLLFVFDPHSIDPTLGRHKVMKVMRWALLLSQYDYKIAHIDGKNNLAADMMTRWLKGYRGHPRAMKRIRHLLLELDTVPTTSDDDFSWPYEDDVRAAQEKYKCSKPSYMELDPAGFILHKDRLWIPDEAEDLQLRIIVSAHCGNAGHRGIITTSHTIRDKCFWSTIDEDVAAFIHNCIHCIMAKTGKRIPRPLSTTLHATFPNQVVHFDYLYLGPSSGEEKYALGIKCDLSSYLWLLPYCSANSENSADGIAKWIRSFGAMTHWVSDQGSHFKNEVMEKLAHDYRISHNFTVAYSPWVNGTVEAVMRSVQAATRSLLTELKLAPHDWLSVISVVQQALNESPLARLGTNDDGCHRSPIEVMTGRAPRRDLLKFYTRSAGEPQKMRTIERVRATQVMQIDELQEKMDDMHKSVSESVSKLRARQIRAHNQKTNVITPNFTPGDVVLVRSPQGKGLKLRFRWIGPRRVVGPVSDLVYDVSKLDCTAIERIHSARMRLYRALDENTEVPQKLLELASELRQGTSSWRK